MSPPMERPGRSKRCQHPVDDLVNQDLLYLLATSLAPVMAALPAQSPPLTASQHHWALYHLLPNH